MCTPSRGHRVRCHGHAARTRNGSTCVRGRRGAHDEAGFAPLPEDGRCASKRERPLRGVDARGTAIPGDRSSRRREADAARGVSVLSLSADARWGSAPCPRTARVLRRGAGIRAAHAVEYQRHIYDRLLQGGGSAGARRLRLSGRSIRCAWRRPFGCGGSDLCRRFPPAGGGMDRWVRLDKGEFIGREPLASRTRKRRTGATPRLLEVEADGADPHGLDRSRRAPSWTAASAGRVRNGWSNRSRSVTCRVTAIPRPSGDRDPRDAAAPRRGPRAALRPDTNGC